MSEATDNDPVSACCAGNTGGVRHEGCVYVGCRCECHRALEMLRSLDWEGRLHVFGEFCKYCGGDDPSCQCWNDE